MSGSRVVLAGAVILLVLGYAVLSGTWVGHEPGWYAALPRPRWQPPDWVFGIMWPLNFLALAIAGVAVVTSAARGTALAFLGVLAASIALALGWAYAFYVPHRLGLAAGLPLADSAHANDLWIATSALHIAASLVSADAIFDDVPNLELIR